ncbi:hypothetical protein ACFWOJ_26890 [Streptomyces sp. NPDC058439]|uniref:hypothetical protein n=1 Tax=Streptomyces sp. NPDC058439 TaxID=3346500 RepID=UPI003667FC39
MTFFHPPRNVVLLALLYGLGILLPSWFEGYAQRRRQRDWYEQRFASVDELRSIVTDEAELRRIRDEKGLLVAARRFRREFPRCPLSEALKMIQSL